MFDPAKIVEKAKHSSIYLRVLNWQLGRVVPFNRPHGFRIVSIGDDTLRTRLPYRRANLNHIRGLHACALATLSEFTTGFLLLSKLSGKYRLIMQRLEMEYHYQGKVDAMAEFTVTPAWLEEHVHGPLATRDAVIVPCDVRVSDVEGHHLTTGKVFWQIKRWDKVKTKVQG